MKATAELTIVPKKAEKEKLFSEISKSGAFFSTGFIKKDGKLRTMHCRTGVKKHLKGGKLGYNAKAKGLLPVYDLENEGYRMVNLNTLLWVAFGGVRYKFRPRKIAG